MACAKTLDEEFTFYIVYGECAYSVDYTSISVQTVDNDVMSMEETDEFIRENFRHKLVVVGASTGTDAAHRRYRRHYEPQGLCRTLRTRTLRYDRGIQYGQSGAQRGIYRQSQRTQSRHTACKSDCHAKGNTISKNLTNLVELMEAEHLRDKVVLCCGGARITHELAKEFGLRCGLRSGQICRRRNFFRRERNA